MARPRPGMGRGLSAILSASAQGEEQAQEELLELPLEAIVPSAQQPRRRFEEESLQALAASVAQSGVLQPVLVRPRAGGGYELVAGERRWRAAALAELATIPALVRSCEDAAALETALVENMAREDLNPIEEAQACAALVDELGLTRGEVGRRVGRGRVAVSNLLRLLELPDEVCEMIERGALSEGHGRALLLAEDHDERKRLAREAREQGWSVRVLEERARASNARHAANGGAARSGKRGPPHADQLEAAAMIAHALRAALGSEVKVRPTRAGYRAELSFASPDEALALARSIAEARP